MQEPIIMEFPLRGEWLSPNTPGSRIPSHGTNRFGTRYAYDFIQVDWSRRGLPGYRISPLRYLLAGALLTDYYCWGAKIYAPCDGLVIEARDHYPENMKTGLLRDLAKAYRNAHRFDPQTEDVQSVAGNFIIIKYHDGVYAALCHLKTGSIRVLPGQPVKKGEYIGNVGHSGNSFAPHLHFQLMDSLDITAANGVPCAFAEFEVFRKGEWETVTKGIPTDQDRIRFRTQAE